MHLDIDAILRGPRTRRGAGVAQPERAAFSAPRSRDARAVQREVDDARLERHREPGRQRVPREAAAEAMHAAREANRRRAAIDHAHGCAVRAHVFRPRACAAGQRYVALDRDEHLLLERAAARVE